MTSEDLCYKEGFKGEPLWIHYIDMLSTFFFDPYTQNTEDGIFPSWVLHPLVVLQPFYKFLQLSGVYFFQELWHLYPNHG